MSTARECFWRDVCQWCPGWSEAPDSRQRGPIKLVLAEDEDATAVEMPRKPLRIDTAVIRACETIMENAGSSLPCCSKRD